MNIEELITQFLDPNHYIEFYKVPHNFKDYTIANDAYTIIFIPRDEKYKESKEKTRFENTINEILNDIEISKFKPLPKINIPEQIICTYCDGSGKSKFQKCHECNGEGIVDANTDYNTYYDLNCKTCNGKGEIILRVTEEKCKTCNGIGKIEPGDFPIRIENMYVKFKFIKKIMNIDNIEISTNMKKNILFFKAKDIKGAMMGILKT